MGKKGLVLTLFFGGISRMTTVTLKIVAKTYLIHNGEILVRNISTVGTVWGWVIAVENDYIRTGKMKLA